MTDTISQSVSSSQHDFVRRWKAPAGGRHIQIRKESGELLGFLAPLTTTDAADAAICEALTRWRHAARESFLTQFTATTTRTRAWLERKVLEDDTRLLFLLIEGENRPIGNIGLCDLCSTSAEIDNVLRGEVAAPRFMYHALLALLHWAFTELHLTQLSLHVFSNNARARQLYDWVGFQEVTRLPLAKTICGDEVRYVTRFPQATEPVDFELVRMQLVSSEFWERHAWMRRTEENG
jgi:RimJ/RimL family protein N-acetyltransferase